MRSCFLPVLALLLCLVNPATHGDDVTISPDQGGFAVATPSYRARIDAQASLTSLVVNGHEFIQPRVVFSVGGEERTAGGTYACPFNQWYAPFPMPGAPTADGGAITAEGHGWKIVYRFHPDAIEFEVSGAPEGGREFTGGYPASELLISFRTDLARAVNPNEEGDIGWPVKRAHEPGSYALLASDGTGIVLENIQRLTSPVHGYVKEPADHTLNVASLTSYAATHKPAVYRLRVEPAPDPAHSLLMEIASPVPGHLFTGADHADFPVTVTALYGKTIDGIVRFDGQGYVFADNKAVAEAPVHLTPEHPSQTVNLHIVPPVPGHYTGPVQVIVDGKPIYSKRLGLVFQPERIALPPVPPDFDQFWNDTLAKLDTIPLDLTLEEQPEHETAAGKAYKARFRAWDGRWAWAWLYVPKKEGKVPGRVQCPAVSNYQPGYCQDANGQLWIAAAVHGGDVKDRPAKSDFDYMNTGIESRDTYMLRYSYSCLVRCYDIIAARPEFNGEMYVNGGSQGAGLSLVLGGLRPDVKEIKGVAIALCRIDWTILGLAKWGPRCPEGADKEQIAQVVRYFDPACFAHRIKAPEVVLGIGLFDFCAPAEGIFSAINAMPPTVHVRTYADPYGGHFTYNHALLQDAAQGVTVPKWQGSAADNKLNE